MLRLTRFRIPAGWQVQWNRFYDPEYASLSEMSDIHDEDLLAVWCDSTNILVDIGWYGGAKGTYAINVFKNDWRGKHILEYKSKNHARVVEKLEKILENALTKDGLMRLKKSKAILLKV